MPATKEELQERAQLIRIHEANCSIDYPTPDELNFRLATMKKLGQALNMKELRTATIEGPSTPANTPARPRGGKAA